MPIFQIKVAEQQTDFFIQLMASLSCVESLEREEESLATFREEWLQNASFQLNRAYSDDEPDYSDAVLLEPNPQYKPIYNNKNIQCLKH